MNALANILLVIGTIMGAVGGARLPEANWSVAIAGVSILAVGAVVSRVARRTPRLTQAGGTETASSRELLSQLCSELDRIESEIDSLPVERLAEQLRVLDSEHLRPLARVAPSYLREFGGARFAEIFAPYASGERLIGRAWSAATDRHRPEAVESFRTGAARVREACRLIKG